MSSFLLHCSMS